MLPIRIENLLGLLILLIVPVFWVWKKPLSNALGGIRANFALVIRSLLVALLVLAISEPYWLEVGRRISIVFVMDRSASVTNQQVGQSKELVTQKLQEHRSNAAGDRVGVIGFGKVPVVELPVDTSGFDWLGEFGTSVVRDQTDIGSALELAEAVMPDDGLRRIVVVSDGMETTGSAVESASRVVQRGIGIDAIALSDDRSQDVAIEKVVTPSRVRPSSPFEVRVIIRFVGEQSTARATGQLDVLRINQNSEQLIASQPIELDPGVNVVTFTDQSEIPGFYTYRARFTPHVPRSDRFEQNDAAESFVNIATMGRVLMVVEEGRAEEFEWIIKLLREEEIAVDVRSSPLGFGSLSDFQAYDLIVLADVPRYLNGDPSAPESLGQSSLELMRQAAESTGCGLLVIGGVKSFGNGDWKDTPVEQAMPVSFDVKNTKVQAVTALELVIDSSGSMEGVKIQLCRSAAREAVRNLKSLDYVGVISFDAAANEIVKLQRASAREAIARLISRLSASGGTNMYPALQQAYFRLRSNPASVKHVMLMTDGQTQGSGYIELVQQMHQSGITVSCMAIGDDADEALLSRIASATGGQFYKVTSLAAIPRVVISETRRIARPLVFETANGFSPSVRKSHPIVDSIPRELPPLTGYVLTTPKDSPLVETLITSPVPEADEYPILAAWQYGLGRTAAWTTDAGQRWSQSWTNNDSQQKLFLQLVRWLLRTEAPNDRTQLVTNLKDEEAEMLLTAMDEARRPLNGLLPYGFVASPKGKTERVEFAQIGPGRYRSVVPISDFGTHIASVTLGDGKALVRSAFTRGYSNEFRIDNTGASRLQQITQMYPRGGVAGRFAAMAETDRAAELPIDFFRRDLPASPSESPAWHWLAIACAILMLCDVANRRIAWTQARQTRPRNLKLASEVRVAPGASQKVTARASIRSGSASAPLSERAAIAAKFDTDKDAQQLDQPGWPTKNLPEPGKASDYAARLKEAKKRATKRI